MVSNLTNKDYSVPRMTTINHGLIILTKLTKRNRILNNDLLIFNLRAYY